MILGEVGNQELIYSAYSEANSPPNEAANVSYYSTVEHEEEKLKEGRVFESHIKPESTYYSSSDELGKKFYAALSNESTAENRAYMTSVGDDIHPNGDIKQELALGVSRETVVNRLDEFPAPSVRASLPHSQRARPGIGNCNQLLCNSVLILVRKNEAMERAFPGTLGSVS